jgi:Tol biopolymer transport system component
VAIPISGREWKDIYNYSGTTQSQIDINHMTQLCLSPDEKHMAYYKNSGNLDTENSDIYIMPSQGGEPIQITDHPAKDYFGAYPSWSYDGRWLVFDSERNGKREPWIIGISPDGKMQGEPFQIPFMSKGHVGPICWTKEGQIGFSTGNIISSLFVANSDGKEEVQLTHNECMEVGAVWSPEGEDIYCSTSKGKKNVFYSVSFKGGEFRKMEIEHLGDFSPDGKKIVYSKNLKTINRYWLLENFLPERKKD